MTESIRFLPVLKLTWEYFKEQPGNFLFGVLLTAIVYSFFQAQLTLPFYSIDLGLFFCSQLSLIIFSLLFIVHLIYNRKRKNFWFHAMLCLLMIGYEGLYLFYFQWRYPDILFQVAYALPSTFMFIFFVRIASNIIDEHLILTRQVFQYSKSIPKIFILSILLNALFWLPSWTAKSIKSSFSHTANAYYNQLCPLMLWALTRYFLARFFCTPFLMLENNYAIVKSLKLSWKITQKNAFAFLSPYILYSSIFFAAAYIPDNAIYWSYIYIEEPFSVLFLCLKGLTIFICYLFTLLLYRLMSNSYFNQCANSTPLKFNGDFS